VPQNLIDRWTLLSTTRVEMLCAHRVDATHHACLSRADADSDKMENCVTMSNVYVSKLCLLPLTLEYHKSAAEKAR
jgi:hypothetical protein